MAVNFLTQTLLWEQTTVAQSSFCGSALSAWQLINWQPQDLLVEVHKDRKMSGQFEGLTRDFRNIETVHKGKLFVSEWVRERRKAKWINCPTSTTTYTPAGLVLNPGSFHWDTCPDILFMYLFVSSTQVITESLNHQAGFEVAIPYFSLPKFWYYRDVPSSRIPFSFLRFCSFTLESTAAGITLNQEHPD